MIIKIFGGGGGRFQKVHEGGRPETNHLEWPNLDEEVRMSREYAQLFELWSTRETTHATFYKGDQP
jgi:hypothetical protein